MTSKHSLRSTSVTAVAMAVVALVCAAPAEAAPPLAGSGNGLITSDEVTSVRLAGGNRIVERHLEGEVSGTLTGDLVEDVRGVVHPDGTVTFEGTLVFEGTLEGCATDSVTFTARLQGSGSAGIPGETGPVTDATVTVIEQASGTVGVTGHGTVLQNGPALTYSIRYSCP